MDTSDNDVLRCPISKFLFKEPVIIADGFTYEKTEIERWLLVNDTSPCTNVKLSHTKLCDNLFMKQTVEKYLKENPDQIDEQYVVDVTTFEGLKNMNPINLSKINFESLEKILGKMSEEELEYLITNVDDVHKTYFMDKSLLLLICKNCVKNVVKKALEIFEEKHLDEIIKIDAHGQNILSAVCCNTNISFEFFKDVEKIYSKHKDLYTNTRFEGENTILHILPHLNIFHENIYFYLFDIFLDKKHIDKILDKDGTMCLTYLFENSNIKPEILLRVVNSCIENDVNLNIKNKTNQTPFSKICKNKNVTSEILRLLLDYFDSKNWSIEPEDYTDDAMYIVSPISDNTTIDGDIIHELVERYIKIDTEKKLKYKTQDEYTLLHSACGNPRTHDKTIIFLIDKYLEYGLDIDTVNDIGWTPFLMACLCASRNVISYFILKDIDCVKSAQSPRGSVDMYLLMKNNQKINKKLSHNNQELEETVSEAVSALMNNITSFFQQNNIASETNDDVNNDVNNNVNNDIDNNTAIEPGNLTTDNESVTDEVVSSTLSQVIPSNITENDNEETSSDESIDNPDTDNYKIKITMKNFNI